MERIKIAILDDDKQQVSIVKKYVQLYFDKSKREYDILIFTSATDFLNSEWSQIDIFLLDVEMPDYNGLEIAQTIRAKNKRSFICFITDYSDYIYKSFDVHAFGYILKPVDSSKMKKLLDDVCKYSEQSVQESTLVHLTTLKGELVLDAQEIVYVEYYDKLQGLFNRGVCVFTVKEKFYIKDKIKNIYKKLPSNEFMIPHQSFIINMKYIKQFKQKEIILVNDTIIPLSQKRVTESKRLFHQYINRRYSRR